MLEKAFCYRSVVVEILTKRMLPHHYVQFNMYAEQPVNYSLSSTSQQK